MKETLEEIFGELPKVTKITEEEKQKLSDLLDSRKLELTSKQLREIIMFERKDERSKIERIIDSREKELQAVYDGQLDKHTEFSVVHANCINEMKDLKSKLGGD